jgi:multidrug efflux pump subunit AcrA (membrane-fusion protein)
MAHHPERLRPPAGRRRRWGLIAGAAGAICAVLLGVAWIHSQVRRPAATSEQSIVVQRRPFSTSINVVGTVVAGQSVEVTAPFDGTIKALGFEYGAAVVAGQSLVVMDTFDVLQHRSDAETTYLKAAQSASEMSSWSSGPEVARARRGVTASDLELKDTERKALETKGLLERGLVARTEYDGLLQQERTQDMALTAAKEDLATALKRGEGPSRQEAAVDLASAKARLGDLSGQLAGATVSAPATGTIVRPPSDKAAADAGAIHAGRRVTRGELIGSIAKAGTLAVAVRLSEADALRVRVGQPVLVTGPGFGDLTITGHIESVAGEATPAENGGGATFAARAVLDPPPAGRTSDIRIGMTANVAIITYSRPAALTVPPQAIQGGASSASVEVRDQRTGRVRAVLVEIGQSGPDAVEIRSGLKPGDVVVWSNAGAAIGRAAQP